MNKASIRAPSAEFRAPVVASLAILSLSLLFSSWARLPWAFDGSRFLFHLLNERGFIIEHGRVGNAVFQGPAWIASQFGAGLQITSLVYELVYSFVPVFSLWLSWSLIRSQESFRHLIVWPMISIGLITAWGANFPTAESIFLVYFLWPILFDFLIRPGRGSVRSWALLLICLGLHPLALLMFALLATQLYVQSRDPSFTPERRKRFVALAGTLLALGALRLLKMTGYETERSGVEFVLQSFWTSVWGVPLLGTGTAYVFGYSLVRRWPRAWILGLVFVALELYWIASGKSFTYPNRFRMFVQFMNIPLVIFYLFEMIRALRAPERADESLCLHRRLSGVVIPCVALALMNVGQSLRWHADLEKVSAVIAQSPNRCLEVKDFAPVHPSTIHPTYLPILSLLLQNSRKPAKIVQFGRDACSRPEFKSQVVLLPWGDPKQRSAPGWMDLSETGL